jgi:hypothetical protein
MTSMWKRGSRHQFAAAATAVVRSSSDHQQASSWQEKGLLSCAGSPP